MCCSAQRKAGVDPYSEQMMPTQMTYIRVPVCAGFLILAALAPQAQEALRYRDFQLGSTLASVAKLTGAMASAATVVHQRPAVMKDLEWRPRYFSGGVSPQTDPVDVILFKFYDDQLFRVVVDYDRNRTEGMTEEDMVEAISATYGPVSSKPVPKVSRGPAVTYGSPDTPLAIWGDAAASVTLLRVAYPKSFKLVVSSTALEGLARTAVADAVRLDAQEAPQRELARQKKESAETLAAEQKAKIENKAVFRP
jgi:hypothetical protein